MLLLLLDTFLFLRFRFRRLRRLLFEVAPLKFSFFSSIESIPLVVITESTASVPSASRSRSSLEAVVDAVVLDDGDAV